MFLSEVINFFAPIFSLASTIFMIWMLVDCVRNQSIRDKAGWVLFILFTQLIGSAVYFFTHGPWPKVRQYLFILFTQLIGAAVSFFTYGPWPKVRQYLFPQHSVSGEQTPHAPRPQRSPAPQPKQDIFSDYGREYQAQQHDPIPLSQTEVFPLQPEYEQPLVMYLEVPLGEPHY